MNHSEQLNELAAALAVAQGQMKPARMNAVNPFLKNKYADLGAVMDACRDALATNGLSFVQMAYTPPLETYGPAVGVETMLMHKSGQWLRESFVLPVGDEKGKSVMQVAGSAISYARRYALAAMLGIVADEDTDGNETGKLSPPRSKVGKPADAPPTQPPARTNGNGNGHKPVQTVGEDAAASWDEMDSIPATIDQGKRELLRGKVQSNRRNTVGAVCSAVAATGAYRSDGHALNAAGKISADLEKSTQLTTDEALALFDKLVERQMGAGAQPANQPALIPEPVRQTEYEEA